jgi:hypothetical protein
MPPREEGNSLAEIRDALSWIGLESQGLLIDFKELVAGPFPFIAHFPDHFVVVLRAGEESVTIVDGFGRRRMLRADDFKKSWDRKVLKITPPPQDAFLPSYAGRPAADTPRIQFKALIIDVGEVESAGGEGEAVDFSFHLVNRGSAPLWIRKVRAACACGVSEKPEEPVEPGASSKIKIKYIPGRRKGPFEETAYVESNDPVFPIIRLTIAGNTTQTIEVIPSVLDFGDAVAGEVAHVRAILRYTGDRAFKVTGSIAGGAPLKATFEPLTGDLAREILSMADLARDMSAPYENGCVIEASLDASDLPLGAIEGEIELTTNLEKFPRVAIPYKAEIVPLAKVVPGLVFLGELRAGSAVRTTVSLSLRSSKACCVLSVKNDIDELNCIFPQDSLTEVPITFSLTVSEKPTAIDSSVTVEYATEGRANPQMVSIPVYAYAASGGSRLE